MANVKQDKPKNSRRTSVSWLDASCRNARMNPSRYGRARLGRVHLVDSRRSRRQWQQPWPQWPQWYSLFVY